MAKFLHVDELPALEVPGIDFVGVQIKNALGITDGAGFSADVVEFAPRQRSPATLHRDSGEMFYVISGEAEFTIGSQTRCLGAGAIVYFPEDTVHVIETHQHPVRFLAVKCPAVEPGGDVVFVDDPVVT